MSARRLIAAGAAAALVAGLAVQGCNGGGGGGGGGGDDVFEPNDSMFFAYGLTEGTKLTDIDAAGGLLTWLDKHDFFETDTLTPGDTLLVYCSFDGLIADIDIKIYNPAEVWVANSADPPGEDYDLVRMTVAESRYYIEVVYTASADIAYDLWYCTVPAGGADPYEDNDAIGTPYAMADGAWLSESPPHLGWAAAQLDATDQDWYEINTTSAGTLKIWSDFYHALGDVDMYLYEFDGTPISDTAGSAADGEYLELAGVVLSEVFYVKVVVADGSLVNAYDLYWEVQ